MNNSMLNPKVLEAWFTLMAEATRGTNNAQEAIKSLSNMSSTPEDFNKWLTRFMPGAAQSVQFNPNNPGTFDDQLEQWWQMMGMVPRNRYIELLEKNDRLERKLKKAEETIQSMRKRSGAHEQTSEEAKKVIDMWGNMMNETIKTQAEWMKNWSSAQKGSDPSDAAPETEETKTQADDGDDTAKS